MNNLIRKIISLTLCASIIGCSTSAPVQNADMGKAKAETGNSAQFNGESVSHFFITKELSPTKRLLMLCVNLPILMRTL